MESVAERKPEFRLVVVNDAIRVPVPLTVDGVSQDGSLEKTDHVHPLGAMTRRDPPPAEFTMIGDGETW